jgi:hypothetical protein
MPSKMIVAIDNLLLRCHIVSAERGSPATTLWKDLQLESNATQAIFRHYLGV